VLHAKRAAAKTIGAVSRLVFITTSCAAFTQAIELPEVLIREFEEARYDFDQNGSEMPLDQQPCG
jgi:hypothetical protein